MQTYNHTATQIHSFLHSLNLFVPAFVACTFHNALSDDYASATIWSRWNSTLHMKCVWHLSFRIDLIPPQRQLGHWFGKAHFGPVFHVSCAVQCACITYMSLSRSATISFSHTGTMHAPTHDHFHSFSHSRAPLNFLLNNALFICICICMCYASLPGRLTVIAIVIYNNTQTIIIWIC